MSSINSTKIVSSIFLLLLTCSCATLKKSQAPENRVKLTPKNLNLLNGTYQNNDNKRPAPLDYFWGSYYKMKEYQSVYKAVSEDRKPYYITLKVLTKKKIKATITVNDTILKSFTIKGRIKNGYFEQNSKFYIIPAIIINEYYTSKFRIGLLNNKKIITDFKKIDVGTVYFLSPFNNSESYYNLEHNLIYTEKKQ